MKLLFLTFVSFAYAATHYAEIASADYQDCEYLKGGPLTSLVKIEAGDPTKGYILCC